MFARDQFEDACKVFAHRHRQWSWIPGHRPGYGFITRTTIHVRKGLVELEADADLCDLQELVEKEDSGIAKPTSHSILNVNEYIVYSASFNVPAFYFAIHDPNGTPLSLQEILQTSVFKIKPPSGSEATDFALTLPSGSFPLISQGDHPTLGTPCWYFHPCESESAVNEFMAEEDQSGWGQETRYIRLLEIWLMVVGSIFNV